MRQRRNTAKFFIGAMNKYVVISTNDNIDYLHYLPIVAHAWNVIGYKVICFYRGELDTFPYIDLQNNLIIRINHNSAYRSATLVQVSRLFAGCLNLNPNDYLLTSDVDMLPCADYWQYDPSKITVWGHDLTDFSEFPICYIGMRVDKWRDVMELSHNLPLEDQIELFLDRCPNAKSDDFYKWWGVDQQEITSRLLKHNIHHIHRGKVNHYAVGRVDRGNWDESILQNDYIDSHLPRPAKHVDSINKVHTLLTKINIKPDWYEDYTRQS